MTLKEIQQKIAESDHKEFYQSYPLEIKFSHVNYSLSLVGVAAIYGFVLDQIEKFAKYTSLPPEIKRTKDMLTKVLESISQLIKRNEDYKTYWNDNLASLRNNQPHFFLPDFPETGFLMKVYEEDNKNFPGAYEYLSGNMSHYSDKGYFTGYMLAYEFVSKDFSKIVERKDAEKKSIQTIRGDFQKKLGEAENEVVEYIARSNEKFNEYAGMVDSLKTQKEKSFNEWFESTASVFRNFFESSNQKIKDFESLYIEKLKLEAPAQYWNKRAAKLRKEGNWWLVGMIACLAASVVTLAIILNMISYGTLQKIFAETSTAIKWSVTFITLISFLAYGLRTFAKLTFSSFHLVRDAEEREQLTYVYLALKKEKAIDQTERHLIMQSLFSRADSGLLKDDSGPTMPGNIIDQVAKK
jgi:ABC-type multidrug transport system fused ATPase/permease subunit